MKRDENSFKRAQRAENAKALRANPVYEEAFEIVRGRIVNLIMNCPMPQEGYQQTNKYRDTLFLMLQLLGQVRGVLGEAINQGAIDQRRLQDALEQEVIK